MQNSFLIEANADSELEKNNTLITETPSPQKIQLSAKKFQVYIVEDSLPPTKFPKDQNFFPLPSTVQFGRIVINVISSLSTSYFKRIQKKEYGREGIIQKWTKYLNLAENKALVSDCFWYSICKFFHKDKYPQSEIELKKRIGKNYIALFLSIDQKQENSVFFHEYFNTLAQSIFYSFFYAFPKSRAKFDDDLKYELIAIFSKMFTGVEISNKKAYYDKWMLDLGTGNVLTRKRKNSKASNQEKSDTSKCNASKKRDVMVIRYSPIVDLYLKTHKYKTRECIPEFRMKYTQVEKQDQQKEAKFAQYREQTRKILEWSQSQKEEEDRKKQQLQNEIKQLKRETINHHKRLDRRKGEELDRGAHEYANYLVSMLNAGITMSSLGVIKKNL